MSYHMIQCPFVDIKSKDIVNAYFFQAVENVAGGLEEPPTIVTVPAHMSDIFGGTDIQSGNWTQEEFKRRFKMREA